MSGTALGGGPDGQESAEAGCRVVFTGCGRGKRVPTQSADDSHETCGDEEY